MLILCYILVGVAIGVISGTLGIGGGVLFVPILIWFFGVEQHKAQGMTLAVLVPPIGLPAVWQYFRQGILHNGDLVTAGWLALGFAVGGMVGAYYVRGIPPALLRMLFGLMLIYIAVRFLVMSDSEVAAALVGLVAVALSWMAYIGLRAVGRKHLVKPDLGERIRSLQTQAPTSPDYYI
jgi:uncharacterized membrane protein YfcA